MHLTTRGLVLLLLAALPIAAATWIPPLQWVAAGYVLLAIGLLFVDWYLAGTVEQFDVRREHDSRLSLGAENPITLHLRNRLPRLLQGWIRDEPPESFPIDERVIRVEAQPGAKWQAVYHVRPLRRGDYHFGDINLRWEGPLQLVVRQGHAPAAGPVKVYPNLMEVRRYDLLLRQNRLQELGLRHARLLGQGTEYERLREYTPDDEYRRINWKATARRRRPVTTEYQTERSQNIMAVVDVGRMMQSPVADIAKLDYVINAVLLLGYVATGLGDKVGLMTFADDVDAFLAPAGGRRQFFRMLELLYAVEAQPVEPDYRQAVAYLAQKQRKRSLVVLFTGLSGGASMDNLEQSVSTLAPKSLPVVVAISDPDIHQAANAAPDGTLDMYRQVAARQLLRDRRVVLDYLERRGVYTLDVPANALSISVVQRYLELKGRLQS